MNLVPKPLSMGEFALRVAARPGLGDWFVLIAARPWLAAVSDRLVEELEALRGGAVEKVQAPGGAAALARRSEEASRTLLVVAGLEGFSEEEWRRIDLLRSRFLREECIVLVVDAPTAKLLLRAAPNLASWIGGSAWTLDPEAEQLSSEEREERLQALRGWAKLTDAQVLELAANRKLPTDPEYAEWLVLLDRGDLLHG